MLAHGHLIFGFSVPGLISGSGRRGRWDEVKRWPEPQSLAQHLGPQNLQIPGPQIIFIRLYERKLISSQKWVFLTLDGCKIHLAPKKLRLKP